MYCTSPVAEVSPVGTTSVGPCLHSTLSFTLAYHTLDTYGLSLSKNLCPCCLFTTWKCVPLVDLRYAQDKMACHLYFALGMPLPPAPQSPFSFHLGSTKKKIRPGKLDLLFCISASTVIIAFQAMTCPLLMAVA